MGVRTLFAFITAAVVGLGGWFGLGMHVPHTPASAVYPQAASDATTQRPGAAGAETPQRVLADSGAAASIADASASGAGALLAWSGDTSEIPLGDGLVSSAPQKGYTYSCVTSFTGGGAEHAGDWIHGSTWNLEEKLHVEGSVSWPDAVFSTSVSGAVRLVSGNGLPVDETTGIFPIQRTDPAWQIDRNPNSIESQRVSYSLPAAPVAASAPSCLPMGAVGIALDGVAIYNALDADGRDAVAHEVQDNCDGHPQGAGEYHYHGPSPCMPNVDKRDTVVGYALDGFPITSLYDASGALYTDAALDACHGTSGAYTDENGAARSGYHYVLTQEYPYTLGCFKGAPVATHAGAMQNGAPAHAGAPQASSGQGAGAPPEAAIQACAGLQGGASCTMPHGGSGTCRTTPDGSFACVPH